MHTAIILITAVFYLVVCLHSAGDRPPDQPQPAPAPVRVRVFKYRRN